MTGGLSRLPVELDAPWDLFGGAAHVATAPALALPAPTLEVLERVESGSLVLLRARIRSGAGADQTILTLAPPLESADRASFADEPADPKELERRKARSSGPHPHASLRWLQVEGEPVAAQEGERLVFFSLPAEGAEIEIALTRGELTEVLILDRRHGLPFEGTVIAAARDGAGCVPLQGGDSTLVLARVVVGE